MEVVTVVATFVGILTGVATLVGLLSKKVKGRKARRLELALAADGPADSYPVRFRCREEEEFHPQSGFHEGLVFEVFNHSDHPVTVKSFGLETRSTAPSTRRPCWTSSIRRGTSSSGGSPTSR